MFRSTLKFAAALAFALAAQCALAQTFPSKAVRVIVAGSPGSSMDISARAIAEPMSKTWGVPVVIEVRAGANSIIGADAVAKAAPDGYTLLYVFTTFVQAPHATANMPYDTIKSFAPVSQATINPLWFAVSAELQAKNVKEYIAEMKASPGKYAYASPGQGSTPHLFGEVLAKRNQLDMLHVPHKGMPPAVLDVVAGRAASVFASYSDVVRHAQAGKIRILAVSGAARTRLTPDIPTFQESGFGGIDAIGFGGFLAPAGTPRAAVDTLSRGINEAIALPEVRDRLASFGLEPVAGTPDAFGKLLRNELEVWRQIMSAAGIKPE